MPKDTVRVELKGNQQLREHQAKLRLNRGIYPEKHSSYRLSTKEMYYSMRRVTVVY